MSDARAHGFFIQPPVKPSTLSNLIDNNKLNKVKALVSRMQLFSLFQILSHYGINNDSNYFEIVYGYLSKKTKTLLITQHDLLLMAVQYHVKDIVEIILRPFSRYYKSLYLVSLSTVAASYYSNSAIMNLMNEMNNYDALLPNHERLSSVEALLEYLLSLLTPEHQHEFFSKIYLLHLFGRKIKFIQKIIAVFSEQQKILIIENYVFKTDCCLHIPIVNWVTIFKLLPLEKQRRILSKNPNGSLLLAALPSSYSLTELDEILKSLTAEEKTQAIARLKVDLALKKLIAADSMKELQHFLSEHCVDLNALVDGDRPVTLAVKCNAMAILKYLSELPSVNLNEKNKDEATALVLAVTLNRILIVDYLASHPDVNLYIVDSKGMTAFDYALIYKHHGIIIRLQQAAKNRVARLTDSKCIHKVTYVTQLAHRLGLNSLREKVIEGSQKIDIQHPEGNFLIKSLPALQANFEEIWAKKTTDPELQTMRDSILLAISLNTKFYKRKVTSLQLLGRYCEDELLLLSSGWYRHGIAIVLYKNYLVICNRGYGSEEQGTITIYRIDRDLVTLRYIEKCAYVECRDNVIPYAESQMILDKINKTSVAMLHHIKSIIYPNLEAAPIAVLNPKLHAYGTCTFVNPKSAVYAMFYLFFKEKNDLKYSETDAHLFSYHAAYHHYKMATHSLRDNTIKGLITRIKKAIHAHDKNFYMSIALQVAKELFPKSLKNIERMKRVTDLLVALDEQREYLLTEPSLYKKYQTLLIKASPDYNVIGEFNRLLLATFINDQELLSSNTFIFESYYIFSTAVLLAIHPEEGQSAAYKQLAKKMVAAGMMLQVEHDLDALVNLGAFHKVDSVLELLLIGKPTSDLVTAIKHDNWQQVSVIIETNAQSVAGMSHPHYKYYDYAGRNDNYLMHLLQHSMLDTLPPLTCVRLLLTYTDRSEKFNHFFSKINYFLEILEKDITAAKADPVLKKAIIIDWYVFTYFSDKSSFEQGEFIRNRLISLMPELSYHSACKNILGLITLDEALVWKDVEWDKAIFYIEQGASPNFRLKHAGFLLMKAAAENRFDTCMTLVEKGAKLAKRCDVMTAINHAIQHKNADILECLLNAHEMDVNELSSEQEQAIAKYCEQPFKLSR